MVGRYKLKLLPHLIRVGIKMPSVRAGENCTDYFMRLGFNESERVQTPADVIEHGNLVNALWMQAQADTMSNALEDLRPSWSAKLRTRL